MRSQVAGVSLIALLTLSASALPVAAHPESFSLDSRLALDPEPRLTASKPLELKSPGLAVALGLGAPLALSSLGTGLMVLGGYPSQLNALGMLGLAVGAASPLALGAGHVYAGDPQRGFWVGLGTYGAFIGGTLLGLGVAYAAFPQAMQAGGQSAGLAYAMVGLPIATLMAGGYTIWALADAHQTAIRANEEASRSPM